MALRARGEDENEIEWSGDQQEEVGLLLVLSVRRRKPIQVRPAEENVATREGRARGGKLSIFPHLTLIIKSENENQSRSKLMQVIHERCAA
jgi:hypothetical protein